MWDSVGFRQPLKFSLLLHFWPLFWLVWGFITPQNQILRSQHEVQLTKLHIFGPECQNMDDFAVVKAPQGIFGTKKGSKHIKTSFCGSKTLKIPHFERFRKMTDF